MSPLIILLAALLLDAALGEPDWIWKRIPHPAVLMGRLVGWFDDTLNTGPYRRIKGVIAMAALAVAAIVMGLILTWLPGSAILQTLILAILLAHRSLTDHVSAVAKALQISTQGGRAAVARIVGRDTADMDGPAIARGAIESAAENFSDGVIAPVFWFLIAGLPGLLLYKITNTADSMIGYRNEKYALFGWAAARLDDVLNWIPARITAGLILLAHLKRPDFAALRADAALHRSPNAGWPEAAMALVIDVALSGPRSYDGEEQEFAFVNASGNRAPGPTDIDRATRALWRSWAVLAALIALLAVV